MPAKPDVVENPHSAKLKVDPNDVPAGTDRVHIEAKQINDLTGDRFEAGYDFGYRLVGIRLDNINSRSLLDS